MNIDDPKPDQKSYVYRVRAIRVRVRAIRVNPNPNSPNSPNPITKNVLTRFWVILIFINLADPVETT